MSYHPFDPHSFIITIDGPAGAGKGTIAKAIAHRFGLKPIDSGLIYRALAHKMLYENVHHDHVEGLLTLADTLRVDDLELPELRHESIGNAASKLAVHMPVRDALNGHLKRFCKEIKSPYKGVIVDGRDIGTTVFPHAPIKLFITANPHKRAERRAKEMAKFLDNEASYHTIYAQILERDQRDLNRKASPLAAAENAYTIDTTDLSIDESCAHAIVYIDEMIKRFS